MKAARLFLPGFGLVIRQLRLLGFVWKFSFFPMAIFDFDGQVVERLGTAADSLGEPVEGGPERSKWVCHNESF